MVLHIILKKGYFVNSFLEKNQKIKEIHVLNGILIIGCEIMNIDCIKGVGPSIIKKFEKIGINTIDELVSYYPFRYEIIKRSNIDELENDDKIYNILDVLSICKEIEVPFVFDYHHYKCNNKKKLTTSDLKDILSTPFFFLAIIGTTVTPSSFERLSESIYIPLDSATSNMLSKITMGLLNSIS